MRPPKITKISREDAKEDGFVPPAKFYYVDAFFNLVFVHRAKRETAQAWVDHYFGKRKYVIRLTKVA